MEEIQLVYGLKNEQLVHIDTVDSGEQCGCICPACKGTLIARKGAVKRHHFAHKAEENCSHGYETTLHLLAKNILSEAEKFWIPNVELKFDHGKSLSLSRGMVIPVCEVELEQRYHPIIPDVVVHSTGGKKLMVEIFVTHKVDEEKQEKIKALDISSVEIDLSQHRELVTEVELREILLGDSEEKYWIYNKREAEVRGLLLKKTDVLPVEHQEVSCYLHFYDGSTEDEWEDVHTCHECPYFWEEQEENLLCTGRLRVKTLEDILSDEEEDAKRVARCEAAESQKREALEREERAKKERKEKYHSDLDKGICPWCGKKLKFRKRTSDKHEFISCSGWSNVGRGCQFTLDMETNAAKNSTFVQQHNSWSEKSKQGKAERKCGWCGKQLVHREPKPDSNNWFRPFLSCSGYPYCKFVAYYTKAELQELNEAKAIKEMEKTEERENPVATEDN